MERRVLWSWLLPQHTTMAQSPSVIALMEILYSTVPRASVNTVYTQMGFISGPDFSPTYRYIRPHTFYPILCKMIQV